MFDLRETLMQTSQIQLVPIGIDAWRVVDAGRGPIGHLRVDRDAQGEHFAVKRFHPSDRQFHALGRFWSRDDAVEAVDDYYGLRGFGAAAADEASAGAAPPASEGTVV